MSIQNMNQLRQMALDTLQKLSDGKCEIGEAAAVAKLCDTVVSTITTELKYAKMVDKTPQIAFIDSSNLLEHK